MKNHSGCQCNICVRSKRFVKIANRRKITHKDKKFLLEILDQLLEAEELLSWKELEVEQIKESGCLNVEGYRNFIRGNIYDKPVKEKDMLNKLWDDLYTAKKVKDGVGINLLSTLIAEIQAVGNIDGNRETTDVESMAIVKKFLKNVEMTINTLKEKSPESEHLEGLEDEKDILESYLPPQLVEEQLINIINDVVDSPIN